MPRDVDGGTDSGTSESVIHDRDGAALASSCYHGRLEWRRHQRLAPRRCTVPSLAARGALHWLSTADGPAGDAAIEKLGGC